MAAGKGDQAEPSGGGVVQKMSEEATAEVSQSLKKVQKGAQRLQELSNAANEETKAKAAEKKKTHWLNPETQEELLAERYGKDSWQVRWLGFIESHKVQTILTLLLLLDVLIVAAELFLNAEYPECLRIQRDAISCCPATGAPAHHHGHERLLSGGAESLCADGFHAFQDYTVGCKERFHWIHAVHTLLTVLSSLILAVFELELIILLVILRRMFFKNHLYLLDVVVVNIALVFEVGFHTVTDNHDALVLLVLTRVWRFVRVGHGLLAFGQKETMTMQEIEDEVQELMRCIGELASDLRKQGCSVEEGGGSKGALVPTDVAVDMQKL